MTAKEKAEELYGKLHFVLPSYADEGQQEHKAAKECALIAVDEIINSNPTSELSDPFLGNRTYENVNYWKQVKKEIEKL
jgi:DNA modification methylase